MCTKHYAQTVKWYRGEEVGSVYRYDTIQQSGCGRCSHLSHLAADGAAPPAAQHRKVGPSSRYCVEHVIICHVSQEMRVSTACR